jgi:hypothetical protein
MHLLIYSYAPILQKQIKHGKSAYQMQHCIQFLDDTQIIPKIKRRKLAPIRVKGHMKDKFVLSPPFSQMVFRDIFFM